MNTVRLAVNRTQEQSLITKDRLRVDVQADFYVCVNNTADTISRAAQTLGKKTLSPDQLKSLTEAKFVDALRAVAANMTMEELHEKCTDFVQKVQQSATEELSKNGLLLEYVSFSIFNSKPIVIFFFIRVQP